ncbi:MAG: tRNA 2-thiocytidine(32) synthetase TtcA [Myxococcota bacterium]|nr:tRNA 2-thiocytidine(32) synthetase TtcA [Myxococcota bacterium]
MSRLETNLLRQIGRANKRFALIEPDDHILVAVSGGKDSWGLLSLLRAYAQKVPFSFSCVAVTLDQGQPGFDGTRLEAYYKAHDYAYHIEYRDTYSVVVSKTPEGKAYCALCSRMRRGILYRIAREFNATKIALGHHRDDFIETLLLNQFYAGRIRSMAPKLRETNGNAAIIRPLVYASESALIEYAEAQKFPIIPCNLCGSQDNLKRQEIKALLLQLERQNPRIRGNLLAALGNIDPTHLLDGIPEGQGSTDEQRAEQPALMTITSPT